MVRGQVRTNLKGRGVYTVIKLLVDHSKTNWTSDAEVPSNELIMIGCAQRIASTLEALNRSWCGVQEQNVRFRERIATADRSNARLRGEITKLKKKLAK